MYHERKILAVGAWTMGAFLIVTLGDSVAGQTTTRASLDSAAAQGNGDSGPIGLAFSADGRYVAFRSEASNLVPGDTNGQSDIFVRDRQTGTTERVSVDSSGVQGDGSSFFPSISADGRYVAFSSFATNLVPGDTNSSLDIFVHDRQSGTTERVSVDSAGAQANDNSDRPTSISADGRYVAFPSTASNLVPGDTNFFMDIFVHDRQTGQTTRVSVESAGAQSNHDSVVVSISADGRYVAFESDSNGLVPGDFNYADVFVHDRQTAETTRVSVDSAGVPGVGDSGYFGVSISADDRYVAFASSAANLVPGDTNARQDIFVHDRQSGVTERVSVDSAGVQGNGDSGYGDVTLSADGRYVTFGSSASNLVPGDTNGVFDMFVHDRQSGATERVSIASDGTQGNAQAWLASISGDGRFVAFGSRASNLVPGDTSGHYDVFVRDRTGGTEFTSLCDPGIGGVIACPCSNAPSGSGRGCNNSEGTGGAILSASGATCLSSDSLVFTTSGERATALSTLWQGPTSPPAGMVYGQGVRCVNGSLKRLFHKSAVGGSITAPNFGAGDPPISARSAARGDVILSGQSRYYFVSYRDPTVLGSCPATSTFNATPSGRIAWSP